ncbi:hypothetical protein MSG28_014245 [Choristoneura fumiferana]|uniref:Uncharacterized protein n=1 Tax=Choristoneura fumiferana TaxID=7141 RepID=A0ACC0JGJ3_CHOFU|nr:hypothetical protein MSG28_014245 [Choristoneura fumiferana]
MSSSLPFKFVFVFVSLLVIEVIPIQLQEGEELKQNNVENSELNDCVSVQRSSEVGVCFGKELLNNLNKYDEAESFSLANGVSFVRDEKTPRHFGSFLDKDPMDFRSMMEDASNLISKRSLHWDLSGLYPGLVMKIGRLLARNLLVPFLLGFKFQLSTLLPLVLGLVLIASKKAFLLAKVALLAVTVFSGGSGFGSQGSYGDYGSTPLSSYTAYDSPGYVHSHHGSGGSGGYYHRHPHNSEYYYREKSAEQTTASPITPDELKDRLERLFITKKNDDPEREVSKVRNARNFAWTPINVG